jgi:hypothetical protein
LSGELSSTSSSTVICADSAGVMVAVRIKSCDAADEDFPSACMRARMLPTSVAWIELSSRVTEDVSREKGDIAGHAHVPGVSESIIPSSEQPSELDAFCATRACLQAVCGRLATEKRGRRGEGQVRIRKKSSGVRGTYPLSARGERGHCRCVGMQCGVVQRWQRQWSAVRCGDFGNWVPGCTW